MMLSLVTSPPVEPISLAEAKAHLRVEHDSEDVLIDIIIGAARGAAEEYTQRALVTQTWDLKLDGFDDVIEVPRPPLQAITSVKYVDQNGTLQTLSAATDYQVDLPDGPYAQPGRIMPAYQMTWPIARKVFNAIEVRFVAGYGFAADVPKQIKQAMLLIIGHLYENREMVATLERGGQVVEVPLSSRWLLDPFYAGRFR
jgi:uncharacterized phiE125 gp8 family phage protein